MQEMEVSKPVNLDWVSVEIFQLSFAVFNIAQEILKQDIFVLREKGDKIHRWKQKTKPYTAPKFLLNFLSHGCWCFLSLWKVTLDLTVVFCLFFFLRLKVQKSIQG